MFLRRSEEGASVLDVDMQVRLIHSKILTSYIDDRGIYLCAVDWHRTINLRKLACDGSRRQSDDTNTAQLLGRETWIKIRGRQKIIPVPASQYSRTVRIINGMDSFSFIQNELSCSIRELRDLDIIVE